jgi:hypothetical protein
VRPKLDMKLGAIAAIILDYAALAFVVAMLALDRWSGIRSGIALDTLLVAIIALAAAAWLAGSRLQQRLVRDVSARTDTNPVYSPVSRGPTRSRDT